MNVRTIAFTASAMILGVAGSFVVVKAQGPLNDTVIVDLPDPVTVRDTTLQPGHYVIRQMPSTDNSRVLQIFSDDGMKLETSVMTIPTVDNTTPEKTEVILHHFGNDYYFDKIWIQGKNYGYEFPVPDSVKARERERAAPVDVAATYQNEPAPSTHPAQSAQPPAESTTNPQPTTTTAQAQPPTTPPTPQPSEENTQMAQNQPPAETPNTAPAPSPFDSGSANRTMPSTAANWLGMLLGGGVLSGAGMTLRRWMR